MSQKLHQCYLLDPWPQHFPLPHNVKVALVSCKQQGGCTSVSGLIFCCTFDQKPYGVKVAILSGSSVLLPQHFHKLNMSLLRSVFHKGVLPSFFAKNWDFFIRWPEFQDHQLDLKAELELHPVSHANHIRQEIFV